MTSKTATTALGAALALVLGPPAPGAEPAEDIFDKVEHHYADSNGVKIHYATLGEGPLIVMLHGFPDFWYSWRHQMAGLAATHRTAAMDLRGYNLSDKPAGVDSYNMRLLVSDVEAVIRDAGQEKAIICGHDWGGMISWQVAMRRPDLVEKLIILNLPHPNGLGRELANNPEQQENSAYARRFQQPDAHKALNAEGLARRVADPVAKQRYVDAFNHSDFEAMLNYYKRNYPRPPYEEPTGDAPKVQASTLMVHGLNDKALLSPALSGTWDWIDADLTLVTIPNAGHFAQQDAADLVTRSIKMWLAR